MTSFIVPIHRRNNHRPNPNPIQQPKRSGPRTNRDNPGFTRLDLVFLLGGVLLLAAVVLPVMAADDPRVQKENCMNNLRIIGQACATYGMDHQDQMPWVVPTKDGGNRGMSAAANVFVQFMFLTNEIKSPKILTCPSDAQVRVATTWAAGVETSVLNPAYRNNAISYFIGLDAKSDAPNSILSGDGNLQAPMHNQVCEYALINSAATLSLESISATWTSEVHGGIGNILFRDGRVKTVDSGELKNALSVTKAAHEQNHALLPR